MAETTSRPQATGILLNKAGKGSYHNQDAINKLIKYIARENGNTKDDLICCGTFGATDFTDIDTTVMQFECVQLLHKRKGNFGRSLWKLVNPMLPTMI